MVDDVATGLGNMKLTSNEEEVILISDEGRLEALESCSLSLIGKFLTCKPFNKEQQRTRCEGYGVWKIVYRLLR